MNSITQEKLSLIEESHDESYITQLINKYILISNKEGIIVIHQRRAHKRILFENLINKSNNKIKSQALLFEKKIRLTDIDLVVFREISDQLTSLGFKFKI